MCTFTADKSLAAMYRQLFGQAKEGKGTVAIDDLCTRGLLFKFEADLIRKKKANKYLYYS